MSIVKEQFKAEKPFKDREEVTAEIRICMWWGDISQSLSFIFAALGAIGDAVNVTLGLEPMSWFLLALVASLNGIIGHMHVAVDKHLLDIESEKKE